MKIVDMVAYLAPISLRQQLPIPSANVLIALLFCAAVIAGGLAFFFYWMSTRRKQVAAVDSAEPVQQGNPVEHATPAQPALWDTLVQVSGDVANASSLGAAIPHILQGILHVTDVDSVRTVIFNPRGGPPLIQVAGDASSDIAALDRPVLLLTRHENESLLNSADVVRERLKIAAETAVPVSFVATFALKSAGRLLGVIWLGGRNAQELSAEQLAVTRSLTNQAAVLVANARLYAEAEQSVRRLHAVLASTAEPVAVIDQTNRFYLVNPAMAAAFGIDAAAVKSRQVGDVIDDPALRRILTDAIDKVNGCEISAEKEQIFTAGVSPIATADGLVGRIVVFHDITRIKLIDALKSDFVSNVSHDLRNPLVYMRAYVNMLDKAGPLNEKQTEFADFIDKGIDRMHGLITALLDLSRIESGIDIERSDVDIVDLLAETAETHAVTAELAGNSLAVSVSQPDIHVVGDIWQLRMALDNLVNNALKFAAGSGQITLSATTSADEVIIGVTDQGQGIAPEDIDHLFDKFYRAARPTTPVASGSGLGLAIVKSVAERHGGRVWCKSEPERGSTFYVALPKTRHVAASTPNTRGQLAVN
ncbi:MAG: ATP-binding protein [Anaerolineae bacterium]|nr:ATP-binding protein [Anaerolineae bacterium]